STLAQQIIEGAEADVFLSASREWAAELENRDLVAESRELFSNRLVIIVPSAAEWKINAPQDLLNPRIEHLALGDPESVPVGGYARQALQTLGLWDRLAGKVVAADDVRQALSYVETGAAEAGIVYVTDAAASRRVEVAAEIDPALCDPIVYPAVLLRSAAGKPAARQLFQFLQSAPAADILRRHGFTVTDSYRPD
ncbi:MAG: molybdate ABC transporter substrate-binding protein, partial [Thermoguttaceae bacterium]|nr:molybdate ABC transporter substrate-binding protein [Thermoguttaceae bacterium]